MTESVAIWVAAHAGLLMIVVARRVLAYFGVGA